MDEHENRDTKMYIAESDGNYTLIGPIQDLDATYVDDCDVTTSAGCTIDKLAFEGRCRLAQEAFMTIVGIRNQVIEHCPNKRVSHLAFHAKKARTRKKNFHRAIKILEENK